MHPDEVERSVISPEMVDKGYRFIKEHHPDIYDAIGKCAANELILDEDAFEMLWDRMDAALRMLRMTSGLINNTRLAAQVQERIGQDFGIHFEPSHSPGKK